MRRKNRARERVDEWLSAYIDGALSPRERARLEARLARDPDLRARLDALQRTVALVRGLPSVPAPRSFLLTPAMVRPPVPAARRLAPALTFATAVSGLLCVILLVGNLIRAGWGGPGAIAPAPMIAYETGASPEAGEAEGMAKQAPPSPQAIPTEMTPLAGAAAISETAVPEMRAWGEGTPSPLERAPIPPDMGGVGGGAEPGPSLREPYGEPEEPPPSEPMAAGEETMTATLTVEVTPISPMPEPLPPVRGATAGEEATPAGTPPSLPGAMPEETPTPPPIPWLPVGGLALLTAALAALSIRAWRAR